ncbi:hypothetical protein B7494_g3673 [Chlorociboria aeruginascens]|nr:hypothetical protein B7494_g3673 [Chlorociboria aeruginascens]
MASKINVGIIGYGMSAKVFHIPFILSSPQFNLYSIVQRTPKPNDNASQDHPSATIYSAPDSLYADPVVDVVIISTTPETHFQFTKAALEAGKHVIVEKPFVPTSSQASALIEIAKEKGKLICVFQNRRWDSDFLAVRGLINNGEFGRIVEFETHYDRFRPTRPETWKGTLGMENAGGVLYDLGSHLIDQVYVLFGIPKNVFAVFRNERRDGHDPDTITVLMDYENGPLVTVKVAILSVEKEQLRFWVRGSKASFKKFGMDSQEEQLKAGLKPGDEGFGVETEERAGRLSVFTEGSEVQERKVWNATPLTYGALYAAFAKAIKGEGETAVPVKASEARDVLKVIEAARESVKTGRRVEL